MKRRGFLQGLGVAGGVALGGCAGGALPIAGPRSIPEAASAAHLRDVIGRFVRATESVAQRDSMLASLLPEELPRSPGVLRFIEQADPMVKRATRGLIALGARQELPLREPVPEAFAEHLRPMSAELDRSATEILSLLEGLSPRAKRGLGRAARERPGLLMGSVERLDLLAAQTGVSRASRLKLRGAAREVAFRVQKGSAPGFMDETASRVRRIAAHHGLEAHLERQLLSASASEAIFALLEDTTGGGGGGSAPLVRAVPITRPRMIHQPGLDDERPPERPGLRSEQQGRPGDRLLRDGGIMVGVGLGVALVAGVISLLSDNIWPIAIGATPAGVLFLIGIIMVLVGAARNA